MASISYDGQSFTIDGRRIWLVSGAIHYPRVPHQLWRQRIQAAKQAGLNCIETYVFWNAHEARPGEFNFEDDLNLRRFVEMVGEEGMWCILRPGPYICAEWDFGGLPPWLHQIEGIKLRQSHPAFLEACARYLSAVMEQVRDLQVTATAAPGTDRGSSNPAGEAAGGYSGQGGGPIMMMQAENEWFSHNPDEHDRYLREMVRYLRENGCSVPINNCNNLWQRIDGTIDTWNGARNLPTDMRQLAVVQPDAPRLVTEYWPGWFDYWGAPHADHVSAELHLYRTAGILATGSQYNLFMFHGGTNFAFWGGRTVTEPGCYMTTSYDYDAPLLEAGGRGPKYATTKRISMFASQFGHVFAHLSTSPPHACVLPDEDDDTAVTVMNLSGSQGQVVFVLRGEKDKRDEVNVMLPDGLTLPVPMDDERVAWLLLGANLGGVAQLNYTNLRPWAFVNRRMLVLFGPAGSRGVIGLDDAEIQVKVPTGRQLVIEQHEDITVVVLNTQQVDETYIHSGGLAIHAAGIDEAGAPIPTADEMVLVDVDGQATRHSDKPARKPAAPRLSSWQYASLESLVDGSDERYAPIDGPTSLEQLDNPYGYGWYRVGVGKAQSGKMLPAGFADRLHVYHQGKLQNVLGEAPGAECEAADLKLGGDTVFLADNLGRYNFGHELGERKGLFDHLYKVRPARLGKLQIIEERAADPFALSAMVMRRRKGDSPVTESLVWKIKPSGRKPMILDIRGLRAQGTWLINGEPLAVYQGVTSGLTARYLLTPGENGFTGGTNELKLSLLEPMDARQKATVSDGIKLYQTTANVTSRGKWAFTPWSVPDADQFDKLPKSIPSAPGWFRAEFKTNDNRVPLWFEPRGLTKGQLYLNGYNVGRYFVATRTGKAVGPQKQYYLPEPWLRTDEPNELLIFDEHGHSPSRSRLVYNPMGPYNK